MLTNESRSEASVLRDLLEKVCAELDAERRSARAWQERCLAMSRGPSLSRFVPETEEPFDASEYERPARGRG